MSRICVMLVLCLSGLTACSTTYQYTRPELVPDQTPATILLAVDFLSIRDDVGQHWDFDENAHVRSLNRADAGLVAQIESHGFLPADKALVSSGIWLHPDLAVDHYRNGKQLPDPIYPPFLIGNTGMSEVAAEAVADLYPVLARELADIEVRRQWLREFNLFNYRQQMAEVIPDADHLLLIVQYHDPSVSLMKRLGLLLLGVGVSQASDYSYASFDLQNQRSASSFAYLIDSRDGQLLWKNRVNQIDLSQAGFDRLFEGFPVREPAVPASTPH